AVEVGELGLAQGEGVDPRGVEGAEVGEGRGDVDVAHGVGEVEAAQALQGLAADDELVDAGEVLEAAEVAEGGAASDLEQAAVGEGAQVGEGLEAGDAEAVQAHVADLFEGLE